MILIELILKFKMKKKSLKGVELISNKLKTTLQGKVRAEVKLETILMQISRSYYSNTCTLKILKVKS